MIEYGGQHNQFQSPDKFELNDENNNKSLNKSKEFSPNRKDTYGYNSYMKSMKLSMKNQNCMYVKLTSF